MRAACSRTSVSRTDTRSSFLLAPDHRSRREMLNARRGAARDSPRRTRPRASCVLFASNRKYRWNRHRSTTLRHVLSALLRKKKKHLSSIRQLIFARITLKCGRNLTNAREPARRFKIATELVRGVRASARVQNQYDTHVTDIIMQLLCISSRNTSFFVIKWWTAVHAIFNLNRGRQDR